MSHVRGKRGHAHNSGGGGRDFARPPVSAGLLVDFDPTFAVTKDGSNLVTAWGSRVGGYSLSAAGAARPTWTAGAINGRPAMTFDGVGNYLEEAVALGAILDGSQTYSAYWIARADDVAGNFRSMLAIGNTADSTQLWYHYLAQITGVDNISRRAPNVTNAGIAVATGSPFDFCAVYDGAVNSTWVNGAVSVNAAANASAPTGCDRFGIGVHIAGASRVQLWNGLIGRVVVYLGAHDTTTRVATSAWLRSRFGL